MDDNRHYYERPNFWPRLFGVIFIILFVIAFRLELFLLLRLIVAFFFFLVQRPFAPPSPYTPQALMILAVNAILFVGCYIIFLRWISLFVLPVQNPNERWRVFARLFEYIFNMHGPAVFVKNGELIARKKEKEEEGLDRVRFASLAFMDLASAIVAERGVSAAQMNQPIKKTTSEEHYSPIRALGPGVGFLESGERIQGAIDLRKQYRMMKNVRGFTSDGIELETSVNTIFTLGQRPDVITVVDMKSTGLSVLNMDQDTKKIFAIIDEIDEEDKREIYSKIQNQRSIRTNEMAYEHPGSNNPPFPIDENHIIAAVLSQPRNTRDGKLEKWTELPNRVAVSVLLDELSRVSYDHLYSLDRPEQECFLYDKFKPAFKCKVKNLGVMAYQFVQRKDGNPPVEGTLFNAEEYWIWEVQELHNPRPLRDRGIKVIDVDFSDFKPIDGTIPEQRFDNWRSQWQKRAELTNADYDLEVMRIRNHARAQAQREIIYNLSQIFKLPGYTQEAIAIRIFQALESAAANPATNRLLPRDTIEMLRNFQRLLIVDDKNGQISTQNLPPADDTPPERLG